MAGESGKALGIGQSDNFDAGEERAPCHVDEREERDLVMDTRDGDEPPTRTPLVRSSRRHRGRLPGSLDEVEQVVAIVEAKVAAGESIEKAAEKIRPDIVLPGAVRWVRRRLGYVRMALLALVTLLPGQLGNEPRLGDVRKALGTEHALRCRHRRSEVPFSAESAEPGYHPGVKLALSGFRGDAGAQRRS
jgi:hypothetical protein